MARIAATALDDFIDGLSPKLRREFVQAIVNMKNERSLKRLAELLTRGQIDEALKVVRREAASFAHAVNRGLVSAGDRSAKSLAGRVRGAVRFDATTDDAVAVMRRNRLRLIQEISQGQERAVRAALSDGVRRGLNPRKMAEAFRDSIGLTEKQELSVQNYRRSLEANSADALRRKLRDARSDRSVLRAIESGEPLEPEKIERMVERYRKNAIARRAETIARTEAMRVTHQANDQLMVQMMESGQVEGQTLWREWKSARDGRTRDTHALMNGQRRRIGEPFVSLSGAMLLYPGDPTAPGSETINCRCSLAYVFGGPESAQG